MVAEVSAHSPASSAYVTAVAHQGNQPAKLVALAVALPPAHEATDHLEVPGLVMSVAVDAIQRAQEPAIAFLVEVDQLEARYRAKPLLIAEEAFDVTRELPRPSSSTLSTNGLE